MRRELVVGASAVLVLLGAAAGHAQPGAADGARGGRGRGAVRTLRPRAPAADQVSFARLLQRHVEYQAGGVARLPAARSAAAPRPAAYFTVTTAAALVYDRPVARLTQGVFAPAALAACALAGPPTGRAVRCVPGLRAAATRALAEETARLRQHGDAAVPTAVLLVDQTVPFATFLQAAYAVALGTRGAPPALQLAVRRGPAVGTVPFFLLPPRAVQLRRGLTPLLLVVRVEQGRVSLTTTARYSSGRRTAVASLAALERVAGELKARDPDRTVAFVTAAPRTPFGEVLAVMEQLRGHYPNVVLGETGPDFARGPGRRE